MATRTGVVDVRPLPHGEKHSRVFREFDGLKDGEAFVLVSDHEPRGLLAEFQAKRANTYEWNVIDMGDPFRVEIEKRAKVASREVSEFLGRDHDRLDTLLEAARRAAVAGDVATAAGSFTEFAAGLVHHIQAEENVLFPTFEKVTGMEGGPTAVMRSEHRMIGRLIEEAKAALTERDGKRFLTAASELVSVLGPHNQKEEHVLYPLTDERIGAERERDELVRALQAQSCDSSCGCCSHERASAAAPGRRLGVV